jgi:hypothetical protein
MVALAVLPVAAESIASDGPNRFQATALLGFGAKSTIGGPEALVPGGSPAGPEAGGGIDRNYDDGYVRVDSEGNAGGITWYWGYRNASQVPGDGTLRLNSVSATGGGSVSVDQDKPALGTEIAWLRDLRRDHSWAFGTKLAFGYTGYEFESSGTVSASQSRITDIYSLGGIVPPGNGTGTGYQYQGSYDLPGPVIDEVPTHREVVTNPSAMRASGTRSLDANVWSFKAGPWVELPLGQRFSAQAGAGLAFALVAADLSYNETVSVTGSDDVRHSGGGSASEVVFGGYVETSLNTHLTERLDLVVGAQFMPLTSFEESIAGRPVEIEFGTAWAITLGLSYRF